MSALDALKIWTKLQTLRAEFAAASEGERARIVKATIDHYYPQIAKVAEILPPVAFARFAEFVQAMREWR